jgi:hypothetical protein
MLRSNLNVFVPLGCVDTSGGNDIDSEELSMLSELKVKK